MRDKNKKRVLIFFGVLLALMVLLLILNSIDFDALGNKITSGDGAAEKKERPEVTVDPSFLKTPDYNEDISLDGDYMKENRNLHYSTGEEKREILKREDCPDPVCKLFFDYFSTVIGGEYSKYPSFFTEAYNSSHDLSKFTAQKLYNIVVTHLSSRYLENGDKDGKYKGYKVYYFDVSYNIKDNNGTFRSDFYGDDGTMPQVFELLEKDGEVKISSIRNYSYQSYTPEPTVKIRVMFFVWLSIFVIFVMALIITRKKLPIPFVITALILSALSLFGVSPLWQALIFTGVVIAVIVIILIKRKRNVNKM